MVIVVVGSFGVWFVCVVVIIVFDFVFVEEFV